MAQQGFNRENSEMSDDPIHSNAANSQQEKPKQLHGAARFRIDRELADTLQGRIYAGIDLMTGKPAVIKEAWKQLVKSGYSRKGHRVPEDFLSERRMVMRLSQLVDCEGIAKGIGER